MQRVHRLVVVCLLLACACGMPQVDGPDGGDRSDDAPYHEGEEDDEGPSSDGGDPDAGEIADDGGSPDHGEVDAGGGDPDEEAPDGGDPDGGGADDGVSDGGNDPSPGDLDEEPPYRGPEYGHPRLWLRPGQVEALRARARDSNPLWKEALAVLAARAVEDMDLGRVPGEDPGGLGWSKYPTEAYAELFAFLSLVSPDETARADHAQRARQLLMHVIHEADKGPDSTQPFRHPRFSTYDRSRWFGEAFPLTVDWIYPALDADEKAAIRRVFLRWIDENLTAYPHPVPVGVTFDPALSTSAGRDFALNNYFVAHMRNIGMMAMALDPEDDPEGALRGYLTNAMGAWHYLTDAMLRGRARGGLSPEGFAYGPSSIGRLIQFLLALHTAGHDDPEEWGPLVEVATHPFWREAVPAYLHC